MSSSRPFSVLTCLLCLALPALAEKPNDNRTITTDSRSTDSSQYTRPKIKDIGGKNLDQWVKDMTHPDPSFRKNAILAIIQFGDDAGQYVPDVCKLMHDHDGSPKMKAIMAMKMMYIPKAHRALVFKELGRCLIDPYSEGIHKYGSVDSLLHLMRYQFGPPQGDERKIIMDLVQVASSSRNNEVREICIDAIITAGPDPEKGPDPRVTDALILRATPFREPAESVRYKAIMALGALGRPQDPKNLDKVVAILKNSGNSNSRNRIIKMWTHVSLMALDEKIPKKELDNIVKMLEDPETHIKIQAVTALGALRDKAHAYVGDVCDMAKRELAKPSKEKKDPILLTIVAQGLGRMGNKGDRVVNTLLKIAELNETDYASAAVAACQGLKELGVNDAATMQALEKISKQPSLQSYQKQMMEKIIADMKNPPKKPLKDAPKVPKK